MALKEVDARRLTYTHSNAVPDFLKAVTDNRKTLVRTSLDEKLLDRRLQLFPPEPWGTIARK